MQQVLLVVLRMRPRELPGEPVVGRDQALHRLAAAGEDARLVVPGIDQRLERGDEFLQALRLVHGCFLALAKLR
jgi:hypothetical protein